jgi:hypothetical protein
VDRGQVDEIDPESAPAGFKRGEHALVTPVGIAQSGREKNLIEGQVALANDLAAPGFVAFRVRGIDRPVAGRERRKSRLANSLEEKI